MDLDTFSKQDFTDDVLNVYENETYRDTCRPTESFRQSNGVSYMYIFSGVENLL